MNDFHQGLFYIRNFLEMMFEEGFLMVMTNDTEEDIKTGNVDSCMEAISAVEAATVYFEDTNGGIGYWAFFIPENAVDALVDYSLISPDWDQTVPSTWDVVTDPKFLWETLNSLRNQVDDLNDLVAYYREPETMQ